MDLRAFCRDGYTGVFCEVDIDYCLSSPCGPGTCIDGSTTFNCICPTEYSGKMCSFSTTVCKNESMCHQRSQCIPKSTKARLVNQTQDGNTEPVEIKVTDDNNKGNNKFLCVTDDDDVVTLPFPSKQEDLKQLKEKIEIYITNELVVDVPKGFKAGVSFAYVLKASLSNNAMVEVSFVVVLNDSPLPRTIVLRGLNALCDEGSLPSEFGVRVGRTCEKISSMVQNATTEAPVTEAPFIATFDYWIIVAAIACVALLLLSGILTLIYVRRRQRRRRLASAEASFPFCSERIACNIRRGLVCLSNEVLPSNEEQNSPVENDDEDNFVDKFNNPVYCKEKPVDDEEGLYEEPVSFL